MYQVTTATRKIAKLKKKVRGIQGGTSAGKTISILLILIDMAQTDTSPTITSIISETIPHLKRGAMRDFQSIMKSHNYWKDTNWNATDSVYTFETGSMIEFFSADNGDRLRGGRRDRAFLNECNNITFEAFEQIEVRTKEFVLLDWNPSSEFWFYTDVLPNRTDVEHIIVTYLDNEGLSKEIISSIEQRKNRAMWWRVYGEGQLGEVENRIYKGWIELDDIPEEAILVRRGIDFGYTNDPTAIVDIYKYNGGYILDEVTYQKGLSNSSIASILKGLEQILSVADSSEPKSIDELRLYGISVIGAVKGAGSINQGISLIQDSTIYVTKRSTNLIKEYRNYLWMKDRSGKHINTPEGGDDHALDAARYAISSLNPLHNQDNGVKLVTSYTPDYQYGTNYTI